jgi:carbonic anhydrase/acetyltransferase-like protein (isoleucine patch superfamily)
MAILLELDGRAPTIGCEVFLAPTAVLVGDVRAVVRERATVAPEVLAAGNPAIEKKKLSGSALRWTRTASDEYQRFSKRYMRASRVTTDTRVA